MDAGCACTSQGKGYEEKLRLMAWKGWLNLVLPVSGRNEGYVWKNKLSRPGLFVQAGRYQEVKGLDSPFFLSGASGHAYVKLYS